MIFCTKRISADISEFMIVFRIFLTLKQGEKYGSNTHFFLALEIVQTTAYHCLIPINVLFLYLNHSIAWVFKIILTSFFCVLLGYYNNILYIYIVSTYNCVILISSNSFFLKKAAIGGHSIYELGCQLDNWFLIFYPMLRYEVFCGRYMIKASLKYFLVNWLASLLFLVHVFKNLNLKSSFLS